MNNHITAPLMLCLLLLTDLAGCKAPPKPLDPGPSAAMKSAPVAAPTAAKATVAEAGDWLAATEKELLQLWIRQERLSWVKATYLMDDTELLSSEADAALMAFISAKAAEGLRFADLPLSVTVTRKMKLLQMSQTLPAPRDPAQRSELARLATEMESLYGKGRYCPGDDKSKCQDLGALSQTMASSHDPERLLEVWRGWRQVAPPMRDRYIRFVELANAGAKELGFADLGELWRSRYDMPPEAFAAEVDRLWGQIRPMYEQLHCLIRHGLNGRYGDDTVSKTGPIPAHLLGNMWAQEWSHLEDLVELKEGPGPDLTAALVASKVDAKGMIRHAERFFISLGLAPLPATFWQRSLFARPRDRDVVCHASAWNVDWQDDLRIKMCVEITAEDFTTAHHELGHNYYQRAYKHQPPLFMDSANKGFHEALGDTIALSVTPGYLKQIGLVEQLPPSTLQPLLQRALDRLAFLPFGLVVDRWRWQVFSGQVSPDRYNAAWWELRRQYQGVAPPEGRSELDFDPGAKYHVAANVPYVRYFIAHVLQFQFHRALCRIAGHTGPLHTCSIYGSKAAGQRLNAMMAMGLSRPWPDALEALTGERQMDASALVEYFEPLTAWLREQNAGRDCGW